MLNQVIIVGRLVKDPEVKTTNDANQVLITYEYTFKLSDIDIADRSLFDELLIFNFGSANRSPLMNIDIKETIVINKTTKQLVEITYDITDLIEVAYNNFLQSLNIVHSSFNY